MYRGPCIECSRNRALRVAEKAHRARVTAKCFNCGLRRRVIKIEARAPLARTTIVYDDRGCPSETDYEEHGPMVEICRKCLTEDRLAGAAMATFLSEGL